ncbi:MAG: TIGR02450 family Trp-rich protein [Wenzhouxiangella sp.]
MNRIHPKKLLHSKWTAVTPVNREKHFVVTEVDFDDDQAVIHCRIEAVMSKRDRDIDWRELKDRQRWLPGWR